MDKPQTVVITGASAGVGRAAARAFAKEGARIGLIARGKERLEETRKEVDKIGGKAIALPADVSDAGQMEAAAETVVKEFGPIDVWVNCAMTTIFSMFEHITPEEFRRATEVTYLGTVNATLAAYRRMIEQNHGTIVQVGSALAYRSIPLQAPYCGAKAAIRGFTDSLRCELRHKKSNVHITMVQMPALNTPQFDWCRAHLTKTPRPVAPVFQPEVAAEAILWSARHKRRELHVGMSSAVIIAANKFFAGLLDWYMARSAVSGQQTDDVLPENRPDNLFEPVPGDFKAHGSFGSEAKEKSNQLRVDYYKPWIAAGLAVLIVLLLFT